MKKIFKYELETVDEQILVLPEGTDLLCVQIQNGIPCLWAIVPVDEECFKKFKIITHWTGHPVLAEAGQYLGTYQMLDGKFVGHCFKGLSL